MTGRSDVSLQFHIICNEKIFRMTLVCIYFSSDTLFYNHNLDYDNTFVLEFEFEFEESRTVTEHNRNVYIQRLVVTIAYCETANLKQSRSNIRSKKIHTVSHINFVVNQSNSKKFLVLLSLLSRNYFTLLNIGYRTSNGFIKLVAFTKNLNLITL